MLDGRYSEVGIGIVSRDGHLWVVEVFRKPAGAPAAAAAPDPAPVAIAAPAPAPAPSAPAGLPAPAVESAPAPMADPTVAEVAEVAGQSAHRWGTGARPATLVLSGPVPAPVADGADLPRPWAIAAAALWAVVALLLTGRLRALPTTPEAPRRSALLPA